MKNNPALFVLLATALFGAFGCGRQTITTDIAAKAKAGPTVQPAEEFDALFAGYPKSGAFDYYVSTHKTSKRLPQIDLLFYATWFPDGNTKVAMQSTVDVDGKASDYRDAYNWAVQALHSRQLSDAERIELKKALTVLPKSAPHPRLQNLVIVSVSVDGNWTTHAYDRKALPTPLKRIYELTGAPLGDSSAAANPSRTTADQTRWKTQKMIQDIDIPAIKAHSEKVVIAAGGKVLDWLPYIEHNSPRTQEDLVSRALILNALINIAYGAPIPVIKKWISDNGLTGSLSGKERALLEKRSEDLTDQEMTDLNWSIEAVWALLWAGGVTSDIPIDQPVSKTMASLLPNLQKNESAAAFTHKMRLRPYTELYPMLDLYYRAHWHTENVRLHGGSPGKISGDIVMERRKALEWLLDDTSDWDDVQMGT